MNKMVKQFGIEGRASAKFLLNLCTLVKNVMRIGMFPVQALFFGDFLVGCWSARRMKTRSPLLL